MTGRNAGAALYRQDKAGHRSIPLPFSPASLVMPVIGRSLTLLCMLRGSREFPTHALPTVRTADAHLDLAITSY